MAPATSVPELQQKLFKQMGLDAPQPKPSSGYGKTPRFPGSRKDQRRAQRVQKKTHRYSRNDTTVESRRGSGSRQRATQQKSSAKARPASSGRRQGVSDETFDKDELDHKEALGSDSDLFDDLEDEDSGGDEQTATQVQDAMPLSRGAREKLSRDDAEIEDYERKLGIKKGRKSLPQAFKDDGLDSLMGDFSEDNQSSSEDEGRKRKRDYDDWLAAKRRKTTARAVSREVEVDDEDDMEEDSDIDELADSDLSENDSQGADAAAVDLSEGDEDDGFDEASFAGLESDAEESPKPQPRKRENPYVAPTDGNVVTKYVPPSLRRAANEEGEGRERLRKQIQGQINRLTDANILSIVKAVEELYQDNARGEVTEILTDVILSQVSKPESLPDQFFVLTGGFCAAIYKIMGPSFGSHVVREVVKHFGQEYDNVCAKLEGLAAVAIPKEASNLITFLTQLYVFEVINGKMIFDYMERLLVDLNEFNVELLLRVCRMAGRLLKRDDAQSLKHVSVTIGKAVAKAGYANVSARTKFMVETINGLNNSKPKAKGLDSAVVSEQVSRMKKHLGDLKSRSRRLDGLAPMGISLEDVEGADTKGKWWLVGASVPAVQNGDSGQTRRSVQVGEQGDESDDEDMDFVLPDYPSKARAQDLRTPSQIAIFTALLSASDAEEGYRQFLNLKLKKDDQLEIGRVLLQCVGSEAQYNNYYALVGKQACSNGRIRFAFQNRLWQIFRGLGESLFGEEADDEETADGERMKDERRVANVARFYASLIANGSLSIAILKPVDLPEVNLRTSDLIERVLIGLLQECRSSKSAKQEAKVEKVFGVARDNPALAAGVHWFLRKKVRKSRLLSTKEAKKLDTVRESAQSAVRPTREED